MSAIEKSIAPKRIDAASTTNMATVKIARSVLWLGVRVTSGE
jgi:hypothetical protein